MKYDIAEIRRRFKETTLNGDEKSLWCTTEIAFFGETHWIIDKVGTKYLTLRSPRLPGSFSLPAKEARTIGSVEAHMICDCGRKAEIAMITATTTPRKAK